MYCIDSNDFAVTTVVPEQSFSESVTLLSNVSNNNSWLDNNDNTDDDDTQAGGAQAARASVTGVGGRTHDYLSERGIRDRFAASSTLLQTPSARRAANVDRYYDMTTSLCSVNNDNNVAVGKWPDTEQKFVIYWDRDDNNYYKVDLFTAANDDDNSNNNNNNDDDEDEDEEWCSGGQMRRCSGSSDTISASQFHAQRSTDALKAIACLATEVDAFSREFQSDGRQLRVLLLCRVLVEYRRAVLGLDDCSERDIWPSALRLLRSAAGHWLVSEVLRHARRSLCMFRDIQASTFSRRPSVSALGGLVLLDASADEQLISELGNSVCDELQQGILHRAVSLVVRDLLTVTPAHQHHQRLHPQSVCCLLRMCTFNILSAFLHNIFLPSAHCLEWFRCTL